MRPAIGPSLEARAAAETESAVASVRQSFAIDDPKSARPAARPTKNDNVAIPTTNALKTGQLNHGARVVGSGVFSPSRRLNAVPAFRPFAQPNCAPNEGRAITSRGLLVVRTTGGVLAGFGVALAAGCAISTGSRREGNGVGDAGIVSIRGGFVGRYSGAAPATGAGVGTVLTFPPAHSRIRRRASSVRPIS